MPERGGRELTLFSSYDVAAVGLVCDSGLHSVGAECRIFVAGFGRFGRAVVQAIVELNENAEPPTVTVLDRRKLGSGSDDDHFHLEFTTEDRWRGKVVHRSVDIGTAAIRGVLEDAERRFQETRFLVCTDQDGANVSFALRASHALEAVGSGGLVQLFTRVFDWPAELELLRGVHAIQVAKLVRKRLPELLEGRLPAGAIETLRERAVDG